MQSHRVRRGHLGEGCHGRHVAAELKIAIARPILSVERARTEDQPQRRNSDRAGGSHFGPAFPGWLTSCKSSATVTGGAPRHTSSITAGGTRQAASHSSTAPLVVGAPAATLAAPIATIAAHHRPAICPRERFFNM